MCILSFFSKDIFLTLEAGIYFCYSAHKKNHHSFPMMIITDTPLPRLSRVSFKTLNFYALLEYLPSLVEIIILSPWLMNNGTLTV